MVSREETSSVSPRTQAPPDRRQSIQHAFVSGMGRVPEVVGRVWYDIVMLAPSSLPAPVSQLTASLSGSDIIHTDVMGSHVFILNSIKTAHDLLDMRSTIYSDRYGLNSDTVTGLLTLLYADSTHS